MSKKSLCESSGLNEDNLRKRKEFIQLGRDRKVLLKLKLWAAKIAAQVAKGGRGRLKNFPVFEVIHSSCVWLGLA
jgi:hypothetical protein